MNLYLRELKRNRRSLIIWTVVLMSLIVLMMAMFPSIARESENINLYMKSFPEGLLNAFNLDTLDFTNIFGFYSTEGYLFVTLFGGIYVILLSSGILSKEESDKTVEFLLSKPITRKEVITSKLLSYITNIVIFNVILSLTLFVMFQIVKNDEFSMKIFILLCIAPFLLHLTLAAIGFFISTLIKKSRSILSVSLGVVLVTYFLSLAANISDKLEFLKYFTPFEYVNAANIMSDEKISTMYLIIMLLINVIFIGLTYIVYNKKDIAV